MGVPSIAADQRSEYEFSSDGMETALTSNDPTLENPHPAWNGVGLVLPPPSVRRFLLYRQPMDRPGSS